ncbi:MAG: hypothetical protein QGG40_06055, partial [Myxococcota bacterium]|nr:hypothetical protein [Myxococcota bacterium]
MNGMELIVVSVMELASLALFLPLVGFAILGVFWPLRHTGRTAGILSSLLALVSLGCAVGLLGHFVTNDTEPVISEISWLVHAGETIANLGIRVDGISAVMLVVVCLVSACVQVYSLG